MLHPRRNIKSDPWADFDKAIDELKAVFRPFLIRVVNWIDRMLTKSP